MKAYEDRARLIEKALREPELANLGDLVRFALALPQEFDIAWASLRATLQQDAIDIDLAGEWLRDEFDKAINVAQQIHKRAAENGTEVDEILIAVQKLQALRDVILTPWPWSHLPMTSGPFDRETTLQSRAEIERGEWITIEDLIAKVQRDGHL